MLSLTFLSVYVFMYKCHESSAIEEDAVDSTVEKIARAMPAQSDGHGGHLRIKEGASLEAALGRLGDERELALLELGHSRNPASIAMQTLVLAELLINKPDRPIDLWALSRAQQANGVVAGCIEAAAHGLVDLYPRLFEGEGLPS